jgi:hypothetical protein
VTVRKDAIYSSKREKGEDIKDGEQKVRKGGRSGDGEKSGLCSVDGGEGDRDRCCAENKAGCCPFNFSHLPPHP